MRNRHNRFWYRGNNALGLFDMSADDFVGAVTSGIEHGIMEPGLAISRSDRLIARISALAGVD
ncbi:hypothetical protein AN477_21810 [Alicyclobacillus ferrooxydans]|uniref:Uncharacterized protein n=1 Tax=Alicyclobacillus ferrooxydans TaxID=471514 RepID=A0A0P9C616_9BACL|nr:hypothetical protein AN477_21810 [Alicyclobacillus ferrooxydans]